MGGFKLTTLLHRRTNRRRSVNLTLPPPQTNDANDGNDEEVMNPTPTVDRSPHHPKFFWGLKRRRSFPEIGPEILAGTALDTEVSCWQQVVSTGSMPGERSGHSVLAMNGQVFLFGGCGGSEGNTPCMSDFICFNLSTLNWSKVQAEGTTPSPRASFEMCRGCLPDTLIIAGGTGSEGICGDMHEYNARTRRWRQLVARDDPGSRCRYYGQTACPWGDRTLVLFGGSSGHEYTDHLYTFDLETLRFAGPVATTGDRPSARYKHQAVVVGDELYVLGGGAYKPTAPQLDIFRLDLTRWHWERVAAAGAAPPARVAHTCAYDPRSRALYLWGGFDAELERLNDFYRLDLDPRP
ncbi:unnamed protein product, partial [Heterosigma akashiwo]